MHLKLVAPNQEAAEVILREDPVDGFESEAITALLSRLERAGDSSEMLDSALLSPQESEDLYEEACTPFVTHAVAGSIRQVFGSRFKGMGPYFGREVPVLMIYMDERVVNVYPRVEPDGRVRTLRRALEERCIETGV